jgi:CheY-like chemotaxis protein
VSTLTRVLVVEDDPWIQWMIVDDLADRGYDVVAAHDGVEALDGIAKVRPDVIVLDLMLPRSSGWDVAQRYQTITGGDAIPIVVVSVTPDPALPLAAGGTLRSLRKPFDIEQLARAVAELTDAKLATR